MQQNSFEGNQFCRRNIQWTISRIFETSAPKFKTSSYHWIAVTNNDLDLFIYDWENNSIWLIQRVGQNWGKYQETNMNSGNKQ